MAYLQSAAGSMLGPKLLGTYEMEIESWIGELIDKKYDTLIDVGAAEGYYAIGAIYRNSSIVTYAFDTNSSCHLLQQSLATLNQVSSRLKIGTEFSVNWLENSIDNLGRVCMFVDVDGAEDVLLNPKAHSVFDRVDLIVETHDCFVQGVTSRLIERFKATHGIERVASKVRSIDQIPKVSGFSRRELLELANEHRPQQEWLRLRRTNN